MSYNFPLLTPDNYEKLYSISFQDEYYFKEQKDLSKRPDILQQQKDIVSLIDFGYSDTTFLNSLQKKELKRTGVDFIPELLKKLSLSYTDITFYTVEVFLQINDQYDCAHL